MMTADLKPYPAYKGSGVPWLGQVPEHWDIAAVRSPAACSRAQHQVGPSLNTGETGQFLG